MPEPLPPRAVRARRRRFERAADRRRDRPDALRLRASWGAHRLELAAAGAPALVVALGRGCRDRGGGLAAVVPVIMNKVSALAVLSNAVLVWNTVRTTEIVGVLGAAG